MAETTPDGNAGARTEAANQNSAEMAEETHNVAAGEGPNTSGGAPSTTEAAVPSTSDPEATHLPTQDNPDPETANPEVNPNATGKPDQSISEKAEGQPAVQEAKQAEADREPETQTESTEEKQKSKPAEKAQAGDDPGEVESKAAQKQARPADQPGAKADEKKAKKEKKPAVEDKPFPEFMQQDYLPALEKAFAKRNIQDLQLTFAKNEVTGLWNNGQRQFTVYFPKEDIKSVKAFSCASNGLRPSTIEPFLIDERAITADLLTFGVVQRLTAEKWLGNN